MVQLREKLLCVEGEHSKLHASMEGQDIAMQGIDEYRSLKQRTGRIRHGREKGEAGGEVRLAYPWEGISVASFLRVFKLEARKGALVLRDFERVLDKLGLNGRELGGGLFHALDHDGSRELNCQEMYIGLAILLTGSREERLQRAFAMMDADGSGTISRVKLATLFRFLAPKAQRSQVRLLAADVMKQLDIDGNGYIHVAEFMAWGDSGTVLAWIDAFKALNLSPQLKPQSCNMLP